MFLKHAIFLIIGHNLKDALVFLQAVFLIPSGLPSQTSDLDQTYWPLAFVFLVSFFYNFLFFVMHAGLS